jgi:hypothetical protein
MTLACNRLQCACDFNQPSACPRTCITRFYSQPALPPTMSCITDIEQLRHTTLDSISPNHLIDHAKLVRRGRFKTLQVDTAKQSHNHS